MNLTQFYSKLRKEEAAITEPYPLVVSLETEDGGRAGTVSEVSRTVAAKMIAEDRGRLATAEESAQFREQMAEAKRAADQAAAASKLQITVVSETELRALRGRQNRG